MKFLGRIPIANYLNVTNLIEIIITNKIRFINDLLVFSPYSHFPLLSKIMLIIKTLLHDLFFFIFRRQVSAMQLVQQALKHVTSANKSLPLTKG